MQHSDMHMTNRNSSGQTAAYSLSKALRYFGIFLVFAFLLLPMEIMAAEENALQSITHKRLAGNKLQVVLEFAKPPQQPLSFTIADPARIALDFANTRNNLSKRTHKIGIGAARSVSTAQAKDRTRVVLNLTNMVNYQTDIQGNRVIVTLAPGSATAVATAEPEPVKPTRPVARRVAASASSVSNIDFRRGRDGAGRVILTLTDPNTPITIKQQGSRVIVDLLQASIPANLQRRLNVTDFATPVEAIEAKSKGKGSQIIIKNRGDFTQLAYQSDNVYTVEIKPATKQQVAKKKKAKEKTYTGERLSLNFQDIEVRSVLQLIADFTGLNVVVSDSVTGNVTLRLKNVPWDQALDIILNTKGLDKRQKGNVLYIAPAEEIAAREKAALEAEKEVQELATLYTEIISLNYADAQEMAALLKSQQGSSSIGTSSNSLLSSRGSVTVDSRTNSLLVQDTSEKLEEIRELINTLDVPVRQVLIEARIVNASDNFTRNLGVSFSASDKHLHDGDLNVTTDFAINLPAPNPAGTLGLALAKIPLGTALDLELSAAQTESTAEIVASPRIVTANKNTARIEQGVEIPYQEASSSGATSTSFKKAVLSLEVTPHITRDDRINMDLNVKRDSVGQVFNNIPSIDTREVQTRVNVDNGQTVVLGGIFEETVTNGTTRVPFLSDIPILGHLFRTDTRRNDRAELLIFVTPKIINDNLTLR